MPDPVCIAFCTYIYSEPVLPKFAYKPDGADTTSVDLLPVGKKM